MRDYQRINNNPYYLPRDVYRLVLSFIRSYPELKERLDDIINESPEPPDGMPSGSATSDPTAQRAARIEPLTGDIRIIERALEIAPEVYRKPTLDNIIYYRPYPSWADRRTFGRWKQRIIYEVYLKKFWYM